MSQENVEIVRKGLEALQRRDLDTGLQLVASEFIGYPLSAGIGPDVFRGREGIRTWMQEFFSAWDQADLDVLELIDAGDEVIARVRWRLRGRSSGLETEREYSAIYTFHDGKVIRYRECLLSAKGPRSRRAAGVGDVAGERGDRAPGDQGPSTPARSRRRPTYLDPEIVWTTTGTPEAKRAPMERPFAVRLEPTAQLLAALVAGLALVACRSATVVPRVGRAVLPRHRLRRERHRRRDGQCRDR